MITQEELREIFDYREDGNLIWKIKWSDKTNIGDAAGWLDKYGYKCITINRKKYKEHCLIWIYHFGNISKEFEIDHINRTPSDNRIQNLRLVTRQENRFNSSAKGYYWHKKAKKWHAQIKLNGKIIYLGCFNNEEDARNIYLEAKKKYHIIKNRISNEDI